MEYDNKYYYNKTVWLSPNKFYADELLNLFAGEKGEVFSFLQANYTANIFLPYGDKIGKLFDKIASEDLFHSKQLSQCIVMLGGNPTYSQNKIFLTTKNINYSQNLTDILYSNIENKEISILNYKTALSKINNKYIQNIINSIIKDENEHLTELKNLQKSILEQTIEQTQKLC